MGWNSRIGFKRHYFRISAHQPKKSCVRKGHGTSYVLLHSIPRAKCGTKAERVWNKHSASVRSKVRFAPFPELPEEFEAHEEGTFDIVRTKRFTVKPMSVEEAILQMNLLGHSFFVFRNTDFGDAICVVYRRNNGGYGIIETEDDEE